MTVETMRSVLYVFLPYPAGESLWLARFGVQEWRMLQVLSSVRIEILQDMKLCKSSNRRPIYPILLTIPRRGLFGCLSWAMMTYHEERKPEVEHSKYSEYAYRSS